MSESKSSDIGLQSALTTVFGERYQLSDRLGKGAYGVVYRARDTMLDREVAIKEVRLDGFQNSEQAEEVKRRTQREAKMAAKLRHPGIVAVHDIIHTGKSTLILMEYVNGETLEAKLRKQGRLSFEQTLAIVEQTSEALDHAHQQGVVHRDIKPANLMIDDDGHVKIADFGIAKSQSGTEMTSNITATGNVLGTPYYMAPEQARGDVHFDGRSDLFSLGCVAYECLAGSKPFRGKSVIDVLLNIVNHDPAELDCDALELHPEIEPFFAKALEKSADTRFQSARELVAALREIPAPDPSGAPILPVVTNRESGASFSFDIELQGSLTERGIADVIRDIQTGSRTGILHVQRDALAKRLYFHNGSIAFANSDVESDRLGQFLIRGGMIDESSYEVASRAMKRTRGRLGRTLVALGILEEEKLETAINKQIQQIIYSVFSWDSGNYGFETIDKPLEDDLAIELSTDEIVLEGVRNMATESTIRQAIGNLDRILHRIHDAQSSPAALTSSEGFVLSRVDGMTSVAEIAAISPLGEDETLRCIYGLVSAGILRLEDAKGKTTGRLRSVRKTDPEPVATAKVATPVEPPVREETKADQFLKEVEAKRKTFKSATLYDILEVSRGETPEAIKKSYYSLAKKYHPDRHQSPGDENMKSQLEEILRELSEAYDVLSVPPNRLRYDAKLVREKLVDVKFVGATDQPSREVIAEAKYRAAKGHYKSKDYHEAVQNLREAVRLAPDKMAYHKLLGQALMKNPRWHKQAEAHFQQVVDAEPYNTECYLGLATIYEDGGLSTRARKMYEQVLTLDPDHEVALEKLKHHAGAGTTTLLRRILGKTNASAQ